MVSGRKGVWTERQMADPERERDVMPRRCGMGVIEKLDMTCVMLVLTDN